MLMYLRKKVLPVLTAGVLVVALSGSVLLLTGCPEESDPMMEPAPTIPRQEEPPEAPDEEEGGEEEEGELETQTR